jgi:hypothetical protein
MHITSLLATSRIEAMQIVNRFEPKQRNKHYVTGLRINMSDDMEFPQHIQRRIDNKGIKVKYEGYLYKYRIKKVAINRKK